MPQIIPPSELINCTDLSTCFQALYNFSFTLFLALCFLMFVYGAFQYLLSGAGIFSKEEGKKRMINSIIALIVILVIPLILNLINPQIFQAKLKIPKVEATQPVIDINAVRNSERDFNPDVAPNFLEPTKKIPSLIIISTTKYFPEWDWREVFEEHLDEQGELSNIRIGNYAFHPTINPKFKDEYPKTQYINPGIKDLVLDLNNRLREKSITILVTDAFNPAQGSHGYSKDHEIYGTAIDFIVDGEALKNLNHPHWEEAIEASRQAGFWVLDERFKRGNQAWTGAHIHIAYKR